MTVNLNANESNGGSAGNGGEGGTGIAGAGGFADIGGAGGSAGGSDGGSGGTGGDALGGAISNATTGILTIKPRSGARRGSKQFRATNLVTLPSRYTANFRVVMLISVTGKSAKAASI
jgi:hypothetical protein